MLLLKFDIRKAMQGVKHSSSDAWVGQAYGLPVSPAFWNAISRLELPSGLDASVFLREKIASREIAEVICCSCYQIPGEDWRLSPFHKSLGSHKPVPWNYLYYPCVRRTSFIYTPLNEWFTVSFAVICKYCTWVVYFPFQWQSIG